MIAHHASANHLLRRVIAAGDDGLAIRSDEARHQLGDLVALVQDRLVELLGDRAVATEMGRAFALRTVDA